MAVSRAVSAFVGLCFAWRRCWERALKLGSERAGPPPQGGLKAPDIYMPPHHECPSGFAHGFHGYLACALSATAPCATKALAGEGSISMHECSQRCTELAAQLSSSCVAFSVYL